MSAADDDNNNDANVGIKREPVDCNRPIISINSFYDTLECREYTPLLLRNV